MANVNFKYVIHVKLLKEFTKEEFQIQYTTRADCTLPLFATKLNYGFGFTNDWSDSYVYGGKWIICEDDLPKKYQQYTKEIDEVFNNNVPYGCCGGCL
jgi:hypothetical protein